MTWCLKIRNTVWLFCSHQFIMSHFVLTFFPLCQCPVLSLVLPQSAHSCEEACSEKCRCTAGPEMVWWELGLSFMSRLWETWSHEVFRKRQSTTESQTWSPNTVRKSSLPWKVLAACASKHCPRWFKAKQERVCCAQPLSQIPTETVLCSLNLLKDRCSLRRKISLCHVWIWVFHVLNGSITAKVHLELHLPVEFAKCWGKIWARYLYGFTCLG